MTLVSPEETVPFLQQSAACRSSGATLRITKSAQHHQNGDIQDVGNPTEVGKLQSQHATTPHSSISTRSPSPSPHLPVISRIATDAESSSHATTFHPASLEHTKPLDLQKNCYARIDAFSPWLPQVDPNRKGVRTRRWWSRDHVLLDTARTWWSRQDILLRVALSVALLVLLVNVTVTAYVRAKRGADRGVVPIYEGSCAYVRNTETIVHIFINIISTLLLGASNLCMQILAAPTREQIDKAHSKQQWLDIGVPSWRNLRSIGWVRTAIWLCLGLTSVPLHFIYNSSFSSSIPCFGFGAAVVTERFFQSGSKIQAADSVILELEDVSRWPAQEIWNQTAALFDMQETALDDQIFANLTKEKCLKTYTNMYGNRTNVLMVVGDVLGNSTNLLDYTYQPASYYHSDMYWACTDGQPNTLQCNKAGSVTQYDLDHWTKFGRPVLYCLSERRTVEMCRLNYSPAIMIAICCVSSVKCLCIFATVHYFARHSKMPLCTLGDAISSFLEQRDPHTVDLGLTTWDSVKRRKNWKEGKAKAIRWWPCRHRWYSSASRRRWIFTMTVCGLAIIVAVVNFAPGVHGTRLRLNISFPQTLAMGFGTPDPAAFTAYFLHKFGTRGFIENVIWANYWQMLISLLYLAYNALLTCQLVGEEWSGFAAERKTLRVSRPRGIQRSSYFISMPLKYGIVLMTANATLHWLVSQSMFVVNTSTFFPNLIEDTSNSFTTTGYSILASLISICFGFCMVIVFIANASLRKYPEGMPLVSTCSVAISAACHPPDEDRDAHLLPVQWGVVPDAQEATEAESRCAFTTHRDVRLPFAGERCLTLPEKPRRRATSDGGWSRKWARNKWD